MSEHDPRITLIQMRDFAERAHAITQGRTVEQLSSDYLVRAALERTVELVGEAANRLGRPFHDAHPEIPWHRIVGMRNILAHGYENISDQILWDTASKSIPEFIPAIDQLLDTL